MKSKLYKTLSISLCAGLLMLALPDVSFAVAENPSIVEMAEDFSVSESMEMYRCFEEFKTCSDECAGDPLCVGDCNEESTSCRDEVAEKTAKRRESADCLRCHFFDEAEMASFGKRAKRRHEKAMEEGKQVICLDCHDKADLCCH